MTSEASEKKVDAAVEAILTLSEMATGVRFSFVVERGRGMNFKVHGGPSDLLERFRDPMTVARFLATADAAQGDLFAVRS